MIEIEQKVRGYHRNDDEERDDRDGPGKHDDDLSEDLQPRIFTHVAICAGTSGDFVAQPGRQAASQRIVRIVDEGIEPRDEIRIVLSRAVRTSSTICGTIKSATMTKAEQDRRVDENDRQHQRHASP